jgi:hypothetical protein
VRRHLNAANRRPPAANALRFLGAEVQTASMFMPFKSLLLLAILLLPLSVPQGDASPHPPAAQYTADAQLKFPEHYREWVYLTSGFDMSYTANAQMPDHHMFDNVFVDPESYKAFLKTGTWPDKTMIVLEHRGAESKGSINQRGQFQSSYMGVEVHVKDEARFPGKWAFFSFDDGKTSKMIPTTESCYSCHSSHAAVDTTFVQFYPTLLPIAQSKHTLSPAYQHDLDLASPDHK